MLLRRKQPTKFTGPQDLVGFGEVERHDITFMASLEPELAILIRLQKMLNHSVCSHATVTILCQYNRSFDIVVMGFH